MFTATGTGRWFAVAVAFVALAVALAPDAAAHGRGRRGRGGYGPRTWGDTVVYTPTATPRRALMGYAPLPSVAYAMDGCECSGGYCPTSTAYYPRTSTVRRSLMGYAPLPSYEWAPATCAPIAPVSSLWPRYYASYRPNLWMNVRYGSRLGHPWNTGEPVAAVAETEALVTALVPPPVPLGDRARAEHALAAGNGEEATKGFTGLSGKDPTDASAWIGLAHARLLVSDFAGGARAARRAAQLGAVSADARLEVATTFGDGKAFRERLSGLKARVRFNPSDADAHALLSWYESLLGESDEAAIDARIAMRTRPDDSLARAVLGL